MEYFIKKIILEGREYIVKNKWKEWESTIEYIYKKSQNEVFTKEYLEEIINTLKALQDKEISDVIANLKSSYIDLNTTYTKSLAEQVAKFSLKGPNFLSQFINTFTEISQQEENRLTKYINDLNKINRYIKEGLNYEEAELMTNKILISLSIDEKEARVIQYNNSFYQGLTKDNKLIFISKLSDDIILSYIFSDSENYHRYLFQDARRTIIPKLLITDKFGNVVDLKKSDDLFSFNNSIILQDDLLMVHNESNRLYSSLNKEVLDRVLSETEELYEINKLNPIVIQADIVSTTGDNIVKKM